jgi:hypothetical protein
VSGQPENRRLGVQIEKARARARNGEHVGTEGWFDVEDSGTPVEVKSCDVDTATNVNEWTDSRTGRYQLEHDNHRNLADHDGEYDFVLRDGDTEVDVVTMSAAEVDAWINENNRKWPENSKLKIKWTDIHDVEESEL